jgi:leader peptidase (prepilin peptidase)/N-methyltransferase
MTADSVQDPASSPVPLMAALGALLGAWAGLGQPSGPSAVLTALFGWQLLLIAVVDAEQYWLPDRLTLPLLASGLAAAAALEEHTLLEAVTGAAGGFLTLWLLAWGYQRLRGRQGLGGGDPILLAAVGAWTGWMGLPSVLLWSALAGLSVAVGQAACGRAVTGTDRLPFGVFLAMGGWLTWMFGPLGL